MLDLDQKGYLIKEDFLRVLCTESSEGFDLRKIPIEYQQQPQQYFQEQFQKLQQQQQQNSPVGRWTMNELEKEWLKEFQRHKQLQEKVEILFATADLNGDGQLSYPEFLFAMAEGSMQFEDFIHLTPNSPSPVGTSPLPMKPSPTATPTPTTNITTNNHTAAATIAAPQQLHQSKQKTTTTTKKKKQPVSSSSLATRRQVRYDYLILN